MSPKRGFLAELTPQFKATLATVAAMVFILTAGVASAATLGTVSPNQLTQFNPTVVPTFQISLNNATSGNVASSIMRINPGNGTFSTALAPSFSSLTNAGWNYTGTGDDGARCNGAGCDNGFALFNWLNHSSFMHAQFDGTTTSSIMGLCILCTDDATPEGIVVRMRRESNGANCGGAGTTHWCIELSDVNAGVFDTAGMTGNTDTGTGIDDRTLRIWYDRTTDDVGASFVGTLGTITVTYPNVGSTYNNGIYGALYSGDTTVGRFKNGITPAGTGFQAGWCVEGGGGTTCT